MVLMQLVFCDSSADCKLLKNNDLLSGREKFEKKVTPIFEFFLNSFYITTVI